MFPKGHLTSHYRMSGSRWMTTSSWLSGSLRPFLYSSSMYSCLLFLISSASVRSLPFLSFIVPISAWNIPLVFTIFLKRSSLFHSIVFLFLCTVHLRRLSYLSLLFSAFIWILFPFLLYLSLHFSAICKVSSDNHSAFLHFFFFGMVLVTDSCSVQFSRSVVSDSLQSHELQHTRPPDPSPTTRVYPYPRPLNQWCHPTISSFVVPFSSCPQSFLASGSSQMTQLFASGGQSIRVSASTSVLPMNTQDWSPLGWTGWISLLFKGLSRVFSNTTVQKHQFFGSQLSL